MAGIRPLGFFGTAYSRIAEKVGAACSVGEILLESQARELLDDLKKLETNTVKTGTS